MEDSSKDKEQRLVTEGIYNQKSGTSISEVKGKLQISQSPFHNEGILLMQGNQNISNEYSGHDKKNELSLNIQNIKETSNTSSNREKKVVSVFRKQKLDMISSSMISNQNLSKNGENTQILSIHLLNSSPRIISPISNYDRQRMTTQEFNYNDEYTFSLFPNMVKINENSLSDSNHPKAQEDQENINKVNKIQKNSLSTVNESKGGGYRMMKLQKELMNIKIKPNKIRINGQSVKFSTINEDDKEIARLKNKTKNKKKKSIQKSTMNIFQEENIYKNQSAYININDQQKNQEQNNFKNNQVNLNQNRYKFNKNYFEYNLLEHSSSRPLTIQATEFASPTIVLSPQNNQVLNQINVQPIFIKQQEITIGLKKNLDNEKSQIQNKDISLQKLYQSMNKNNAYQSKRKNKMNIQSAVSRQISAQEQKKLKFLEIKSINPSKPQQNETVSLKQKSKKSNNNSQTEIIEIFSNQTSALNTNYPFQTINFKESEISNVYSKENSIESCKRTNFEISQNFLQILSPKNEFNDFKNINQKSINQDLNDGILKQHQNRFQRYSQSIGDNQKFHKIDLSNLEINMNQNKDFSGKQLLNQSSNLTGRRPSIIEGNLYQDPNDEILNSQGAIRSRPIIKVPTTKSIYEKNQTQSIKEIQNHNYQNSLKISNFLQQEDINENLRNKKLSDNHQFVNQQALNNINFENEKIMKLDEDSELSVKYEQQELTTSNYIFKNRKHENTSKKQVLSLRERSMQDIRKQIHKRKLINMNKDVYRHYTQHMRSQKLNHFKNKSYDFSNRNQPLAKIILNYCQNPENFIQKQNQTVVKQIEETQKHEICVQTNSNIQETENNSMESIMKIQQSQNQDQFIQKKHTNPISEDCNKIDFLLGITGQQIPIKIIYKKEDVKQIIINKGISKKHKDSQLINTEMKIYEGQSQKYINYSSSKKEKMIFTDQYSSLKKNKYENEILMDEQNIESNENQKSIKNILEDEENEYLNKQELENNAYNTFHELNTNNHNQEGSQSCQHNLINNNSQEDMLDSIINHDKEKITVKNIVNLNEINNNHQIFVGQGFIQVNKKVSKTSPLSQISKVDQYNHTNFKLENQQGAILKKIGQKTVIKGHGVIFHQKQVPQVSRYSVRQQIKKSTDQKSRNKLKNININLNLMKQFQSQNLSPKTSKYFNTEQDINKNIEIKSENNDYELSNLNNEQNDIQIKDHFYFKKQNNFNIRDLKIKQSKQLSNKSSKKNEHKIQQKNEQIQQLTTIEKKDTNNQFKVDITQNYQELQQKIELQEKILNITEDLIHQLNKKINKQNLQDDFTLLQNFNIKSILKVQTPKDQISNELLIQSMRINLEEKNKKMKDKSKQKLEIRKEEECRDLVQSLRESNESRKILNQESAEQLPFQPALSSKIQTNYIQTFQQSQQVSPKNQGISKQSLHLSRNNKNTLPSKSHSTHSKGYLYQLNKDKIKIKNKPLFDKVLKSQLFNEQINSQFFQFNKSPSNQSQKEQSQIFDEKLNKRKNFGRIRSINFISSSGNIISNRILPSFSVLQSKNSKLFHKINKTKKSEAKQNKIQANQNKIMNINSQNSEVSEDDCVNFQNKDLKTGIETNNVQSYEQLVQNQNDQNEVINQKQLLLNQQKSEINKFQYKSVGLISPTQKIRQSQRNKRSINRNSVQLQTLQNRTPLNLLMQSQKLQETLKDFDVTVESVIIKKINQISTNHDLKIVKQKDVNRENTGSINTLASDNFKVGSNFHLKPNPKKNQNFQERQKYMHQTIQSDYNQNQNNKQILNIQEEQQYKQINKVSRLYNFENKQKFNKSIGVRYQQNYLKELKNLKYKADHNLNMSYLQFQQKKIEDQFKNVGILGYKKDESILNMIKSIDMDHKTRKRPSSSQFQQNSFNFLKKFQ